MTADRCQPRYLASYGKCAAVGSFWAEALELKRGERVVVESQRGLEVATILCPASERPTPGLGIPGTILRRLSCEDESIFTNRLSEAQRLFEAVRRAAELRQQAVEVLDAEILFDGRLALLQILAAEEADLGPVLEALAAEFPLEIRCENLALGQPEAEPAEGCGKPDCGKTSGGSCSSCATGSCSSCGSAGADLRPYFAHLREQMAARTPLL